MISKYEVHNYKIVQYILKKYEVQKIIHQLGLWMWGTAWSQGLNPLKGLELWLRLHAHRSFQNFHVHVISINIKQN